MISSVLCHFSSYLQWLCICVNCCIGPFSAIATIFCRWKSFEIIWRVWERKKKLFALTPIDKWPSLRMFKSTTDHRIKTFESKIFVWNRKYRKQKRQQSHRTEKMFSPNAVNLKITKIIFRLILNDFKEIVYSFWFGYSQCIETISICVCEPQIEICTPEGLYWLYVFDSLDRLFCCYFLFSLFRSVPLQNGEKKSNKIHDTTKYVQCEWKRSVQTYHHKCH